MSKQIGIYQFSLQALVLVLSSPAIFASLSFVLRHGDDTGLIFNTKKLGSSNKICLKSLECLYHSWFDSSLLIVVRFSKCHSSLSVTSDDLNTINFFQLVAVSELDVVEHERPDVVAEPVSVQLLRLETDFDLHTSGKSVVDGFVELKLKQIHISLSVHPEAIIKTPMIY